MDKKKLGGQLEVTSEALKKVLKIMRKFLKVLKRDNSGTEGDS